jgi:hypothetical protein
LPTCIGITRENGLRIEPKGDDLINAGKATFIGDRMPFDQLRAPMVAFAPAFEILPGTAPLSRYQQVACHDIFGTSVIVFGCVTRLQRRRKGIQKGRSY